MLNKIWPGLFPALFVLSTSCSSPDNLVVVGAPSHDLDEFLAFDAAQFLCSYSRGTLPNWHEWRKFQDYLSPSEVQAFSELERTLKQQIPSAARPKVAAVNAYIARHTHCVIDPERPIAVDSDTTGARGFTFQQTFPAVPNVPEPPGLQQMTPLQQEEAWGQAFDAAQDTQTFQKDVRIVVEPGGPHGFRMRSNIRKLFTEPIQEMQFWQALEAFKMGSAFEFVALACLQNDEKCESLREHWRAAERFRMASVERFRQSVTQKPIQIRQVALTGSSAYSVADFELTNNSEWTFTNIIFTTDEVEPQLCELQNIRTKRTDQPLVLAPGETRMAYCALSPDTRPWVKLSVWIAN